MSEPIQVTAASAAPGNYAHYVTASMGHALFGLLRQRRLILAAFVSLLPAGIPVAIAFLSRSQFAENGARIFINLVERGHLLVMAPLLALFFATMLVGQDVENQTIPYVLTRPIPRSAWLLGRFIAYMIIATVLLGLSIVLTFAASTSLEDLGFNGSDLQLLFHYLGVMVLALLAYGALTLFLGAATKRPVVYGVALIYGWQSLAMIVPGLVDFLTIRKYVEAVLPAVATMRDTQQGPDNVFTFDKQIYAVGAGESILTLALITAAFVVLTVVTVRAREYASAHAAGA